MKLRLTPLNIVIALLLVVVGYQFLDRAINSNYFSYLYLLLIAFTCFIADMLFRRYSPDLKRIWIIELLFIIFAVGLIAIIRAIIS